MAVLLLDNYDSFTYNLYDCISDLGYHVDVIRNNNLDFSDIDKYSHIVLSPGPGLPKNAGCLMELISTQLGKKPILGVCLGMQALAMVLDDVLYNLEFVMHGRQMLCEKRNESFLLKQIPEKFLVGLYHSWAISGRSNQFDVTSISEEGVIMSMENYELKCFGVQFHPESILTPQGKIIIDNFLSFNN